MTEHPDFVAEGGEGLFLRKLGVHVVARPDNSVVLTREAGWKEWRLGDQPINLDREEVILRPGQSVQQDGPEGWEIRLPKLEPTGAA
ncbi:MAG: hypothetical protein M1335_02140 [Chloroflexi bacterium]|nr:hypothetical protein [Chloroflexota bacterium]